MAAMPMRSLKISIHALRGEGDYYGGDEDSAIINISIHALRGEGDVGYTLSEDVQNISIHALRGEGD